MDVPYKYGDYWYYARTEAGKQYPIRCRRKGSMEAPEEALLDLLDAGPKTVEEVSAASGASLRGLRILELFAAFVARDPAPGGGNFADDAQAYGPALDALA